MLIDGSSGTGMKTDSSNIWRPALVWPMLLLAGLACRFEARANPTGGTVAQGQANISGQGTSLVNINQTSGSAWINWSTFNVGQGETVNFNQPSINSITWNQINDANPSTILGNINANGYVVFQNANGFSIGGQAVLTAHGIVMTTAATPTMNLANGGPWVFDAPPPTAKIQNLGQINITGGGTAYLIAADIVNGGTISAPNGRIGLYDGETVLVSTSPNGEGLSAQVTLPQGSVDNEGKLTANGGTIVADAQFVNQNGIVQADTAQNVNGTIELIGSSSVTLGANSSISATGDPTVQTASAGGSVQIQAGTSYSDASGSSINVSGGGYGGNAGQIFISAPQMTALNSTINGQAASGYVNGTLTIDTADIVLNSDGSPVVGSLALDVAALSSGFSQINLQASGDITLSAPWILAANGGVPGSVLLQAGNEIALASGSEIEADGGNIILKAPIVDQGGTLQANSIGSANGVVEIDAGQSLTLEGSSAIYANGDSSTMSPGGFVILNAGNTFTVDPGATISVSGNAGGQSGIVELFDPGAGVSPIEPLGDYFAFLVNPYDMTFSGNPTDTSSSDPNLNVSDLAAYSQIDLQTLDNIQISTLWSLNNPVAVGNLSLTAGNNITLGSPTSINSTGISAGQNWNINLAAGTAFVSTSGQPTPASGSDGIYLDGGPYGSPIVSAYITAANGNINLWAANEVQVGWNGSSAGSGIVNAGAASVTTTQGGSISVTAEFGDINSGSNPKGFDYRKTAPFCIPDPNLGGISTADGGNVTIAAGGDVISYLPSGSSATAASDGGTGAFGAQPGNVTVTAGGNVYGHYVVANGIGTINAGKNAGAEAGDPFALSLISGGWTINAPNGNIYLQEVRNPNGDFNNTTSFGGPSAGHYRFTYGQQSYVDLSANGVYLTDDSVPRYSGAAIPVLYPPILDIAAGSGGVTLEGDIALFPSVDQNLNITTTDNGNLITTAGLSAPYELLMSDSAQSQWKNSSTFSDQDHGTLANEPNDVLPVVIDISGSMENLNLIVDKVADIMVGGDMVNCGFSGQNLQASDATTITVNGRIYNSSPYSFINLSQSIPNIPAQDLLPFMSSSWDDIFTLAVDLSALSGYSLKNLNGVSLSDWASTILSSVSLFTEQTDNGQLAGLNPGFIYNTTTGRLGFTGPMTSDALSALTQPLYVLHLVNGQPVVDQNPNDDSPGRTYGQIEADPVSWAPAAAIQALFSESQGTPSLGAVQLGYRIGGPGQFDITANSISLGNSDGILSCGIFDPQGGYNRYENLASITPVGATINVSVTGADAPSDPSQPVGPVNPLVSSLDMLSSTIASLDGGDVNVLDTAGSMDLGSPELFNSTGTKGGAAGSHLSFGIYTTGGGNVNVTALDDVNINGSRIATYDGGDIAVESQTGNVNVGSGSSDLNVINTAYNGEAPGNPYVEDAFGSGIQAKTLLPGAGAPPNPASAPGNITVEAPEGSVVGNQAGIIQEVLAGNFPIGPTVTLDAGTANPPGDWSSKAAPIYTGNIDFGNSPIIGGTVNLFATGYIHVGQIISHQNANITAAQSFSGDVLSGGQANVAAGGSVSGTIVGVGGVSVDAGLGDTASLLGQNVSVNGGAAQSTLGSSATATSATQAAAQQASSQAQQQVVADQTSGGNDDKKKETQIRKVGRVTVLLSSAASR